MRQFRLRARPGQRKSETLAADPIFMAALRTRTYPGGMYSRDYVIRMIQQFVVLLARIAGLKAKDDPEILLLETEAGLRQFTGMDPELVRSLSAAALLTILSAPRSGGPHGPCGCGHPAENRR
jgi:hypothetical protein